MAVKVRVRDFQSIKDATVEIDGFTVVTGPNNSGKTALQRAVRGAFENTGGSAFVRHGTQKCIVDMEFSDGHSLTWEKGTSSKPAYRVDDGQPIHPGRAVPDEVRALGVKPITAGGQEIWPNIAPQFTGQVFLIDKPGSVLAEAVADVERVGHLNRALRRVASDQTRAAADLRVRQEDLAKHEAQLSFYQGLDRVEAIVVEIEKLEERTRRMQRAVEGLTQLRDRLRQAQQVVLAFQGVDQIELPQVGALDGDTLRLQQLMALRDRWDQATARVQRFRGVDQVALPGSQSVETLLGELEEARKLRDRLDACRATVTRYSPVTGILMGISSTATEEMLLELREWRSLKEQRDLAEQGVLSATAALRTAEADVDDARREFDGALTEVGACPLCGHSTEA